MLLSTMTGNQIRKMYRVFPLKESERFCHKFKNIAVRKKMRFCRQKKISKSKKQGVHKYIFKIVQNAFAGS